MPFLLIIIPFAMLFGVVAKEAGLDLVETMAMTTLVIAGAAQFTALALWQEHAPTLIVILTATAVNLRMAMYSIGLVPHFGKSPLWVRAAIAYMMVDQIFALSAQKFSAEPRMTTHEKTVYYFSALIPIVPVWLIFSFLGAALGQRIPASWGLDFAVPICFIAIIAPMLRSLPHLIAAFVSVVASLLLAWLPYSFGVLIAGLIAMIIGAQSEIWLARREGSQS